MKFDTQDYLKKTLLETQERVRDYMNYSDKMSDPELKSFFREYAESEGYQARQLRRFINDDEQK